MLTIKQTPDRRLVVGDKILPDIDSLGIVKSARKVANVKALRIEAPTEIQYADGKISQAKAGDWLLQGDTGDVYFVSGDVFRRTYQIID